MNIFILHQRDANTSFMKITLNGEITHDPQLLLFKIWVLYQKRSTIIYAEFKKIDSD